VINCNNPIYGTPEEIARFIDMDAGGLVISYHDVPLGVRFRIYQALQASPTIPGVIKHRIIPVSAPEQAV
jgi:hypothetical protein